MSRVGKKMEEDQGQPSPLLHRFLTVERVLVCWNFVADRLSAKVGMLLFHKMQKYIKIIKNKDKI